MQRFYRSKLLKNRLKIILFVLVATTTIALTVIARPVAHLTLTAWSDRDDRQPLPPGTVDDASHLNQTQVTIKQVKSQPGVAEVLLQSVLRDALRQGKKVAIAGSRHTMGGHTLYAKGISLAMLNFNRMQFNPATKILTVQSGAKWSDIIPYLNERGYSVAVMQSNNDFSVGGTMSANAHGWQHNSPPFASTVESFRLMLASGKVVQCSRQENPELFSLVLGGYGLFGIILDVDLRVVPNETYIAERFVIKSENYIDTYRQRVDGAANIGMAYGRLSVAPESFLQEAILTTYRQIPQGNQAIVSLEKQPDSGLPRTVFRGSIGSDYGKNLRWQLEKIVGGEAGSWVLRNQILNRPSTLFENRHQAETDILHEYFIPPQSLEAFLEKCRVIIPQSKGDLLNVTVRNVHQDNDSFLRYADGEVFGLVMLFHQQRSQEGEAKMEVMTQKLIEAALAVGGRYYLPYRLHATPEQFRRAYPQSAKFFALKRKYDPNGIFQNYFYLKYGK
ncbi:FAD-binding oxidoreductase [Nostoc sp. C057]|uniref:FAD-binding oxidoreductase n=1 Tax=Nostoc sp. C057 TaxID=2576903 RepID=UPI0015C3D46F|nr:FAD-binding oxidoreductase [Nostoc sp. C057]QLE50330.1 FAD-binding oxidoreductase [Nostoc sp. C057]